MKTFKFEIIITDSDFKGDEFWEDALKRDGTGIADLTDAIKRAIIDSNLILSENEDFIKLTSYTEK